MLVSPAKDRKGNLVGSDSVGKFGTPKCEFIAKLVQVVETENKHFYDSGNIDSDNSSTGNSNNNSNITNNSMEGVYVGCHPSLGEMIASALFQNNLIKLNPYNERNNKGTRNSDEKDDAFIIDVKKEVAKICGCDMRTG